MLLKAKLIGMMLLKPKLSDFYLFCNSFVYKALKKPFIKHVVGYYKGLKGSDTALPGKCVPNNVDIVRQRENLGMVVPYRWPSSLIRCIYQKIGIGFWHLSQSLSKHKCSMTACVTFRMISLPVLMTFAAKSRAFLLTVVA